MIDAIKTTLNLDARPLWNSEYTLTLSEKAQVTIGFPMNKGVFESNKHFQVLSLYSTIWNSPSMNTWNILSFFDGLNSIRDIINNIQQQYPDITSDEIIEKINQLSDSNFIVFI